MPTVRYYLTSLVIVGLAACGDNAQGMPIDLNLRYKPALIAYRGEEGGTWTVPSSTDEGLTTHYHLANIDGPYVVAVVVTCGAYFAAQELHASSDEDETPFEGWPDNGCVVPPALPSTLSGNVGQSGSVSVGAHGSDGDGTWTFDIPVASGLVDVVAVSDSKVLVEHGLRMQSGANVLDETIDIGAGDEIANVAVDVSGLDSSDAFQASSFLSTQNGSSAIFETSSFNVKLTPATQMRMGDNSSITFDASSAVTQTARSVIISHVIDQVPPIQFPAKLATEDFAFDENSVAVSWPAKLPADDSLLFSYSNEDGQVDVRVTAAWRTAVGSSGVAFDDSPPGYDSGWHLSSVTRRSLSIESSEDGILYRSGLDATPSNYQAQSPR